jgi:hypothetical protein
MKIGRELPMGANRDDFQRRRCDIFVENQTKRFSSSVRSGIGDDSGNEINAKTRRRKADEDGFIRLTKKQSPSARQRNLFPLRLCAFAPLR